MDPLLRVASGDVQRDGEPAQRGGHVLGPGVAQRRAGHHRELGFGVHPADPVRERDGIAGPDHAGRGLEERTRWQRAVGRAGVVRRAEHRPGTHRRQQRPGHLPVDRLRRGRAGAVPVAHDPHAKLACRSRAARVPPPTSGVSTAASTMAAAIMTNDAAVPPVMSLSQPTR